MKFNFILLLIIFSLSLISANTYYELNLNYNENSLELNSWKMEISPLEKTNNLGFWVAEVADFNGEILDLAFFDTGGEIFWDETDPETGEIVYGGVDYLENFNFTLYVPYYENAETINIYDETLNKVLEIDVSMYSKELPVKYGDKPITQNQTIDEEEIVPREDDKKSKSFEEKIAEKWWILGIALFILLIILIKSFTSKKNPKKHLYN